MELKLRKTTQNKEAILREIEEYSIHEWEQSNNLANLEAELEEIFHNTGKELEIEGRDKNVQESVHEAEHLKWSHSEK